MADAVINSCQVCHKDFPTKTEWKDHMLNDHDTQIFTCDLCPKVFYNREDEYIEHFDAEHRSEFDRHTCHLCGASYKWFKFLHNHIKDKHKIEKLMECNVCGEEFYNSVAYKKHMKLKHGEKSQWKLHKCDKCHRSFTAKELMALHDKFDHSKNGGELFREYALVHLGKDNEDLYEDSKKCVRCKLKYSSTIYLMKHIKSVHNKQLFYLCCQCNDAFYNTRTGLSIHLHFEHGIPRDHKCGKCTKAYSKPPVSNMTKSDVKLPSKVQMEKLVQSNRPAWANLYIRDNLPKNLDLTEATEEQIGNLRSNIKNLFHVLSTEPPSKLRGTVVVDPYIQFYSSRRKLCEDLSRVNERKIHLPDKSAFNDNKVQNSNNDRRKRVRLNKYEIEEDMETNDPEQSQLYSIQTRNQLRFECNECGYVFRQKKVLERHILTEHYTEVHNHSKKDKNSQIDNETNGVDDKSGNDASKYNIVVELMETDVKNEDIKSGSDFEDEKIQTNDKLKRNIEQDDSNTEHNKYKCDMCKSEFTDQLLLLNHLTEVHSDKGPEETFAIYKCTKCGEVFSDEMSANEHLNTHTPSQNSIDVLPKYSSTDRGKNFNNKQSVVEHTSRNRNVRQHMCKKCDHEFANGEIDEHKCISIVDKHVGNEKSNHDTGDNINAVSEENDSTTQVIDKENLVTITNDIEKPNDTMEIANNKAENGKHRILTKKTSKHTVKRLYKCLKCDCKFAKRHSLFAHVQKNHKINTLFRCEKCNSVFKLEERLKRHIRLKHNEDDTKNVEIPIIKVKKTDLEPIPDKNLPDILTKILSTTILNSSMHKCKICLSYFPSTELLQRHVQWEHTNVNLHKCGQCGDVLYNIEDLELHMNTAHSKRDPKKWKKNINNYEPQTNVCHQ